MKKSAQAKQPVRKREVINISDDDSPSGEPAVKIEKRQDGGRDLPDPSLKVAELQQQLEKKEMMFQKACRAAREAELRAERAESQLDSKRGIVEGVEKDAPEKEELKRKNVEMQKLSLRCLIVLATVMEGLRSKHTQMELLLSKASEQAEETKKMSVELEKMTDKEAENDEKLRDLLTENGVLTQELMKFKDLLISVDDERSEAERQCSVLKEEMNAIRKKDEESEKIIREMKEELERLNGASNKESEFALEKITLTDQMDELRRKMQETNQVKSRLVGENYQLRAQVEELERKIELMTIEKGLGESALEGVVPVKLTIMEARDDKEIRKAIETEIRKELEEQLKAATITKKRRQKFEQEILQQKDQLKQLKDECKSAKKNAAKNVANLMSQLESAHAQANAERLRHGERIDELSAKLNEYERRSMVCPPPLRYPVNQFPPGFPPPFPPHRF